MVFFLFLKQHIDFNVTETIKIKFRRCVMYTILELSKLANVSTRTLRYYDEIELLLPSKLTKSGYRLYDEAAVDRLQHILFYKALGVSLRDIKSSLDDLSFNEVEVLTSHYKKLLEQKCQLEAIIQTVEKTIASKKGVLEMSVDEKFEGLKQSLLDENEATYGDELRESYDESFYEKSQEKFKKMSKWQFEKAKQLDEEIIESLKQLVDTKNPNSDEALELAKKHKEWIMFYWPSYSKEAHVGLGEMYVADERFKKYYDKHKEGAAQFLCDAIKHLAAN